jgi:hypothetical protein
MTRGKRRLIVCLLCIAVAIAACSGIVFVRAVLDVPRQAYAVWWTADLVIAYMESHDGAWPRNWEDLRALAEPTPEVNQTAEADGRVIVEFRPNAGIEELQNLVEIDWGADPDELLKAPRNEAGPPFRVIYLRNGRSTHYEGREPNQMILDYLESRHRRNAK